MSEKNTMRYVLLRIYSNDELLAFLEEQLKKGLIIEKCKGNFLYFRKNTIKNPRLSLVSTECTKPDPSEDEQITEYLDIAKRKGWQLLCIGDFESLVPMRRRLYFYTTDPDIAPFERDEVIDFQYSHRGYKSTLKWTIGWALSAIAALITTIPFMQATGFSFVMLLLNASLLCAAAAAFALHLNRRKLFNCVTLERPIPQGHAARFFKLERLMIYALCAVGASIVLLLLS